METVLQVDNLQKNYGPVRALKGVSFSVPQGSVFGILGPNGSGKTTLLGIVTDILKANKGSYLWFGDEGSSSHQRRKIGTLLETPNFYTYMSGQDNLLITSAISGRGNKTEIEEVLKKVNLFDRRKNAFKSYSLGMKQRLAIAAALLGNPGVLVLDEPTNGLDPVGIAEIRNLIMELKGMGHTVIMASHLLDEVEKVCTHAAILKQGELITTGPVEEIMMDEDLVELCAADLDRLYGILTVKGWKLVKDDKAHTVMMYLPKGEARLEEINKYCFDNGVVLSQLVLRKKRLEARFFELTN
ncbi:MAG: ATP-binding cassette domain-containing protein [Chitinophagaceae bacterium]|nr:ATP-binding cassette domain-containing protein [Chitinophagaceae bacterium]